MRRFFVISFLLILMGASCTKEYEKRYDNPSTATPGRDIEVDAETESAARVMASSTVSEPEAPMPVIFTPTSSVSEPEMPFIPTSSASST